MLWLVTLQFHDMAVVTVARQSREAVAVFVAR